MIEIPTQNWIEAVLSKFSSIVLDVFTVIRDLFSFGGNLPPY
jgi:hypothetical protein